MYRPQLPLPNARRDYASPSLGSAAQGRHHSLQFRRVMATATIAGGVVLLGAAQPAGDPTSLNGAASTGLHYDIHLTIVTTPAPDPTGVAATPTTTTALAHAQVANGKAHIDIADGYFSGSWLTPGDFLIVRDSGRTIIVVSPKNKLYANVDIGQLAQGANSPANAFGGMAGVQATKVKIDATPLALEKLGQVTAQKFEVTEDYTVSLAIMGMTSTTVTHTTTDLWFAPALTAIINPFAVPITRDAPTTMFFGQDYATRDVCCEIQTPGRFADQIRRGVDIDRRQREPLGYQYDLGARQRRTGHGIGRGLRCASRVHPVQRQHCDDAVGCRWAGEPGTCNHNSGREREGSGWRSRRGRYECG